MTSTIPVKARLRNAVYHADARMEVKAILYALIHHVDTVTLACFPSIPTLARGAGMNKDTASKALAALVGSGAVLRRDRYDGKVQLSPVWIIVEPDLRERLEAIQKPRHNRELREGPGVKFEGTPKSGGTPKSHPTPVGDFTPPLGGDFTPPWGEISGTNPVSESCPLNPVSESDQSGAPAPAAAPRAPRKPDDVDALHAVYRGHRPRTSATPTPDSRKALTRILGECDGKLDVAGLYFAWVFQSDDQHARQLRGELPWLDGKLIARCDVVSLSRNILPRLAAAEAWDARGRRDLPPQPYASTGPVTKTEGLLRHLQQRYLEATNAD
jgi:hypothetical protein